MPRSQFLDARDESRRTSSNNTAIEVHQSDQEENNPNLRPKEDYLRDDEGTSIPVTVMTAPDGYIRLFGRDIPYLTYGQSLIEEFYRTRTLRDLEDGIETMQLGLSNKRISREEYADGVINLANALWIRFQQRGNVQDLDEAVSYYRQALELSTHSHSDCSDVLDGLACVLHARFEQRGDIRDLKESITFYRQALESRPVSHPGHSSSLDGLANALRTRFQRQGDIGDLDESISLHRQALGAGSAHTDRSVLFNNLANAVMARYNQSADDEDLDESISLYRKALDLRPPSHPARSSSLNNLATALSVRFSQHGDLEDLYESILLHRQALQLLPPHHPNRPGSLSNLAIVLRIRFTLQGNIGDLDESISLHRQALELRPGTHPDRSASLNNLAIVLASRFGQLGDPEDLNDSISFHRQALELFPSPHPNRADSLSNIAYALWVRYQQGRNEPDLQESITAYEEAIKLRSTHHPRLSSSLDGLANVLHYKFQQDGDVRDLNRSISLHRQALELRPSQHPDHANSLNNLAIVLRARYEHQKNDEDLEESISQYRQALQHFPESHPNRPGALSNLANALLDRFSLSQNIEDLDKAFELRKEALEISPCNHPRRAEALKDLAEMHMLVHQKVDATGNHLDQAMGLFSEASQFSLQSSSGRFRKAAAWANYADKFEHSSALHAFEIALSVLPELAALSLDVQTRHDSLARGSDGIARKAASCAIRSGNLEKAVEFLETGRGVFWSQFLRLRSPMEQLVEASPELANELRRISIDLEQGSHRGALIADLTNMQKFSLEEQARRFEQLSNEWTKAVEKARAMKGFEDFLRPQKLSTLQKAARDGPVVYLIANDGGSTCLIVTSAVVRHIPLPGLTGDILSELVQLTRAAASEYRIPRLVVENVTKGEANLRERSAEDQESLDAKADRGMRPERRTHGRLSTDDIFRHVLGILWDQAVKPVIDCLGLEKSKGRARLTWCTTGLFTFLPIHAAGHYKEGMIDCAMDYLVSSYTPTIGLLLAPRSAVREPWKLLAVIESRSLPSTREELKRIQKYVGSGSLIEFAISQTQASAEAVASHLYEASIVHFACHGKQDSTNPLESGLVIGNEMLTIARIMKEAVLHGSLAFLSACETAVGDDKVPDEAMNIAASLLFTGFQRIVATMWRMWDEDGPVIADAFYRELFKAPDGTFMAVPDVDRSAEALSIAVNEIRARGVPFKRWVPFIYMGI